jgi:hypothetical protein
MRRWAIETPWFSLRLHHWIRSDDKRHLHDHPWAFWTFVLKGSYIDVSGDEWTSRYPNDFPADLENVRRFHLYFRPASHRHYVEVPAGGCWTLVLTGPKVRYWGFWVRGKFRKANGYFKEHGSHVCD